MADAADGDADMIETVSSTPPAALSAPLPLDLFRTIKTAQAQNGLKHADYTRYRHHCTSKLESLYKVLKLHHGRKQYQKKKLEVQHITDAKHLLVPLFSAERAWAYSMELKKEIEASPNGQKRQHLVSRLKKAVYWANELARFASQRSDSRGALEAQAYLAWLHGSLLMEKEKDWTLALAKLTRARKLMAELGKVGSLEQAALVGLQVEELEPAIRYCTYQISRSGAPALDEPSLTALADTEGVQPMADMQAQLQALASAAEGQAAAASVSLEWQGVRYPVNVDKVKAPLLQAQELGAQLDSTSSTPTSGDTPMADAAASGATATATATATAKPPQDPRLALYERMMRAYNEARNQLRSAQKALPGGENDPQFAELSALEAALSGTMLQRAIDRSSSVVKETESRFAAALGRLATGKRLKDKGQFAKAEDMVRLYEQLARSCEELGDLGARMGGRRGEGLHEVCSARSAAAKAARTYYVAHVYLGDGKPAEAHALFVRAAERATAAAAGLEDAGVGKGGPVGVVELQRIAKQAAAYRAVARTEFAVQSARSREEVAAGVGGLTLKDPSTLQGKGGPVAAAVAPGGKEAARYLTDHLDAWESFAGEPGGKGARVYKAPYALQAIAVHPIMLDTAVSAITYPSLDHRLRKSDKKSSVLSSLFGWRK